MTRHPKDMPSLLATWLIAVAFLLLTQAPVAQLRAEDGGGGSGKCSEEENYVWEYHWFGSSGACFLGAPNTVHSGNDQGKCGSRHYVCPS